jgi:hypothetical protein
MATTAESCATPNNQTVIDHFVAWLATGMLHWANRRNEPRPVKAIREVHQPYEVRKDYWAASSQISESARYHNRWF